MNPADRLFIGIYPTGIVYADREVEVNGDYRVIGRLPYDTLVLQLDYACPGELIDIVRREARKMYARAGEEFEYTTSRQTVLLGSEWVTYQCHHHTEQLRGPPTSALTLPPLCVHCFRRMYPVPNGGETT